MQTIVIPWNDVDALERAVAQHKDELAAVITEPILHNIGVLMPKEGFLQRIRELTERYGIVFILDEVVTGFRHSLGGAQKLFGIRPDLTTLAKAMANGYLIGCLAGRSDIMNRLRPLGDVTWLRPTMHTQSPWREALPRSWNLSAAECTKGWIVWWTW